MLLDEQQRLLEVNDAAVTVFQRGRGELLGRPLPELLIPADRGAAARQWAELMRAGEGTGVRVALRPDGTNVEVDWAARVASIGGRQVAIGVMLRTSALAERSGAATAGADLTRREREVVTLIALGHDTREIASLLVVSPETVKSHVRKAMSKLQARTRAQLVAVALATGQIAQVAPLDG